MCGIAGIFDLQGDRPVDESLLARMSCSLWHRGPDGAGRHLEPGLGLAHRRLAIIDRAGGQQPLFNEDGTVALVYNGEIYNFQELVEQLTRRGHTFRTRCDSEVIVHAWEEWGRECVNHFRGMFAFALWDRSCQLLFLARDRLGIKPLYYALPPDGRLTFGSELKALVADPGLPRELDPRAVEDYFAYGYVPDPRAILQRVWKLPPGHTLTVRRDQPVTEPKPYWDIPFAEEPRRAEPEGLAERLQESVGMRMVSEVPLGAFLSGGVDSSAVVAMMAGLSREPVHTSSIAFDEQEFDEARYAARVAERYGTAHRVRKVSPNDFGLTDTLPGVYDEPFADSSALPTYRVCEAARRHVTVALSGDGGDEGFAGYRRYRWHLREQRLRQVVPPRFRRPVFGALGRAYPKLNRAPRFLRAKATFQALARDAVEGYFHSVSVVSDPLREKLFTPAFKRSLEGYRAPDLLHSHAAEGPDHPLSLVQYLDFKTYLAGDILTKVDRASMAHSLEVRVPLLDHRLVEWAATIDPAQKLAGGNGKALLKRAMEPHLPQDVLYRRKMGFAVPLADWFRGPLREPLWQTLTGDTIAGTGIFDTDFLAEAFRRHQTGERDHSALLWSMLMFAGFLEQMGLTDSPAPAAAPAAAAASGA